MAEILSAAERRALEAAAERLIPPDEAGPGAGQAGAIAYVERALAGPYAGHRDAYREGVCALENAAARHGGTFAELAPEQQDTILRSLEESADFSERAFFELLRTHVIEGMFGDPSWGGNIDQAGWRLLDYPGPRRAWTDHEQQLDVVPCARRGPRTS